MSFLGLANLYAMRVNLSVAIVAMSQSGLVLYDLTNLILLSWLNWTSRL